MCISYGNFGLSRRKYIFGIVENFAKQTFDCSKNRPPDATDVNAIVLILDIVLNMPLMVASLTNYLLICFMSYTKKKKILKNVDCPYILLIRIRVKLLPLLNFRLDNTVIFCIFVLKFLLHIF